MIAKPLPHAEARERIAALPRVSRAVMDGMLPELKAYAFTVTGLDVSDQMARVQDSIAAVPAGQKTWDESRKEIAAELADALGGKQGERRAELLLRTHVFRSYAATRYRLLMEQRDVFPFWQYKTHGDGNVRPSHMALNGKIFPAGHEIWQRIFPPWDWGCRCLVVPLTSGAVKRMQDAGMEPQANEGDTLLKTQIVRPEVFDPRMADVIEKGQRLPSGESLNPSPTWSGAPWSIPGNIRHDWPLIEARYKDQPEVLEAFREWAGKAEIEHGFTVSMWVGGESPRSQLDAIPWPTLSPAVPGMVSKEQIKAMEKKLAKLKVRSPADYADFLDWPPAESGGLNRLEVHRGVQSFLDHIPADIASAAGKFTIKVVDSLPNGVAAQWKDGVMYLTKQAGEDDLTLRSLIWHEMAHWLWDAPDYNPRLSDWRRALLSHFEERTQGDKPEQGPFWQFLRDNWINPYAGRIYPGKPPGIELPAVYFEALAGGPYGLAAFANDKDALSTFEVVMSIMGDAK